MRIDLFLKKVGILESRSNAKNLITIKINGSEKKASHEVKTGDEVEIIKDDGYYIRFLVLAIPSKNVSRDERVLFYKILEKGKVSNLPGKEGSFLKWLFENH